MTRDISRYESAYVADYGFERQMVSYRRQMLLERLDRHQPKIVIEVGCGTELLYRHYLQTSRPAAQWVVVEPGEQFARAALEAQLPNSHIISGYFEDTSAQITSVLQAPPDLIICSCLLHEVPDVQRMLNAIVSVMDDQTLFHINVPNSSSFHRRLAKSMGLIDELNAMSQRNQQLQQFRVYDRDSLDQDLMTAGLTVVESGGYFIKPFTHQQMELITPQIGQAVLNGLYQLGKETPELASEIFVEARKRKL